MIKKKSFAAPTKIETSNEQRLNIIDERMAALMSKLKRVSNKLARKVDEEI